MDTTSITPELILGLINTVRVLEGRVAQLEESNKVYEASLGDLRAKIMFDKLMMCSPSVDQPQSSSSSSSSSAASAAAISTGAETSAQMQLAPFPDDEHVLPQTPMAISYLNSSSSSSSSSSAPGSAQVSGTNTVASILQDSNTAEERPEFFASRVLMGLSQSAPSPSPPSVIAAPSDSQQMHMHMQQKQEQESDAVLMMSAAASAMAAPQTPVTVMAAPTPMMYSAMSSVSVPVSAACTPDHTRTHQHNRHSVAASMKRSPPHYSSVASSSSAAASSTLSLVGIDDDDSEDYSEGGPISRTASTASIVSDSGIAFGGAAKKRRAKLPDFAVTALKNWLRSHRAHPYPSETEKGELSHLTNLSLSQVNNWFTNARRRILPREESALARSHAALVIRSNPSIAAPSVI